MSIFNKMFDLNEEKKVISGLVPELRCLYASNIFINQGKNVLYVTNTLYEANRAFQSISNYTSDVLFFPMDDFLTSEALAISPELKNTRLETISELLNCNNKIVVTNLMGYLRFLPKKEIFEESRITIQKNCEFNIKNLISQLYNIGYSRETIVTKTGEIAVRGFVIDIFPIGVEKPVRLEFFGDFVEVIKNFDVETQRTEEELEKIEIKANTEFLIKNKTIEDDKQKNLYKYTDVVNISNYLKDAKILFSDYAQIKIGYKSLINEIFEYNVSIDAEKNTKYMNDLDCESLDSVIYLENFDENMVNVENTKSYNSYEIEPFSSIEIDIFKRLEKYIKDNKTVILCLNNKYQINKVIDIISNNNNNNNMVITNENEIFLNKINLVVKNINNGYVFNDFVVISEKELFNKRDQQYKYKSNFRYGSKIRDITKLNIGDYIVHSVHGIGKYLGLKTLEKNKLKKDYLLIEYKGGDKLYIPVEKIDFISKYSSNDGIKPNINKLGSNDWAKTKLRIKKKIESIAGELLELYAKRESSVGFSFEVDTEEQIQFENYFMFDETPDQLKAIEDIKEDMQRIRPMDRLLCGDVGYGKTEVAFRAIFKAILSGKQVAFLCPTTILSSQHYKNAVERFKEFPINIEIINRFVSTKKVNEVIKKLKDGQIDVLIGTHKLLNNDFKFKDLGLLVIDEEQRFGVKHKEKIKTWKNNIDVLTLSATPIPRTLQMAMAGIRNLSLIETPPVNRYPIQTYVLEENDSIVKDAIYKELSREGQVFVLYNRVEDIETKMKEIQKLVPEAKINYIHGRMDKLRIENTMISFTNREFDVLVCTTIIETGIDIPNVNTLIIKDADRFGLSQLYQIRGRVGRSDKIAYCYLMYQQGKNLTEIATKRLSVIKEFTELGSGFSIAMRDLSIRGAGDILGSEQAGFIDTVGIELYLNMLNEEVNKLKGIIIDEEIIEDKPLINVETTIDDKYVEDVDLKIEIHKKINTINSYDKLQEIKTEIEDRFGIINNEILIYMYEEWFEKMARELKINRINQTNNLIEITLPKDLIKNINGELLFFEVNNISRKFRFNMRLGTMTITLDTINLDKHFIYYLIDLMEVIKKAQI